MDSRLIFLHFVKRLNRRGRCTGPWPTTRIEGARKGEADLLPKHGKVQPRKAVGDAVRIRTKTDTGGRGEYPNGARENGP
jgi:hypothetical protein